MQQARSYAIFAGWFAVIGPLVVLPVPMLLLGAHLFGAIPGVLTGIALARRYASVPTPPNAGGRAISGFQVGSTISCLCFILGAVVYRVADLGMPDARIRLWLEDAVLFGVVFVVLGGIAGAFAFAVMPESFRITRSHGALLGDEAREV
jgi:hypothetical protein